MKFDGEFQLQLSASATLTAVLIWGFSPLYYRAVGTAPALEILAHRVVWSLLLLLPFMFAPSLWRECVRCLASPRRMGVLFISSILVSVNWLVFIWAVNNHQALEASMGYFIMPLVMVLLGRLFLHEHLSRNQLIAVVLAGAGVLNLLIVLGALPWVALALAGSFGVYSLVRKMAPVSALVGLAIECLLLAPMALFYLLYLFREGTLVFGSLGLGFDLLLMSAAFFTAVPLILYAVGFKRLRLGTVGLIQYLNPTCQFFVALFLFAEPLTQAHGVTFGLIWIGLALFTWELRRGRLRAENAVVDV